MYFGSESFVYMNRDKLRSVFLNVHTTERRSSVNKKGAVNPSRDEYGGAGLGQGSQGTLSQLGKALFLQGFQKVISANVWT